MARLLTWTRSEHTLEEEHYLSVYTDGASRGNPGPAAIGFAIYDSVGNLIEKDAKFVGRRTNNEAEYEALIWGLERVRERSCSKIRAFSDSELVVRQINGEYRISEERLKKYANTVRANKSLFESVKLSHVPRENPRTMLVDEMVNLALDRAGH